MVFTVLVAAEVGDATHNFDFPFPTLPTLQELSGEVEKVFRTVSVGSVTVSRLQVYDERVQKWAELSSGRQLRSGCQVYADVSAQPAAVPSADPAAEQLPPEPAPSARRAEPAAAPAPPEEVTQEGKARRVFDEMDRQRGRRVTAADLEDGLRRLEVSLTRPTLDRLFSRGDADGAGYLGFSQWCRVAEAYPKLLDTLWHRIQQRAEEDAARRVLGAARAEMQRAGEASAAAAAAAGQAAAAVAQQEVLLAEAGEGAASAAAAEAAAAARLDAAAAETARAGARLQDAKRDHTFAREREQEAAGEMHAAASGSASAAAAVTAADSAAAATWDRVRELEHALAQARRDAEAAEAAAAEARRSLEGARAGEEGARASLGRMQQDVAAAADGVLRSEGGLSAAHEQERQAAAEQRAAGFASARARQAAAAAQRDVEAAERGAVAAAAAAADAGAAVEHSAAEVDAQETALADMVDRRRAGSDEEQRIVDEEVRLRAQRDALEQQEQQLGHDHGRFRSARNEDRDAGRFTPHRPATPSRAVPRVLADSPSDVVARLQTAMTAAHAEVKRHGRPPSAAPSSGASTRRTSPRRLI